MPQSDPREQPLYSLADASRFLLIPRQTLAAWTRGRFFPARTGRVWAAPLITTPNPEMGWLSFANLAEAHVLAATRDHGIPMVSVRAALTYLENEFPGPHPLLGRAFYHNGKDIFIKVLEGHVQTINVSCGGQLRLRPVLDEYLSRLERDRSGVPVRLFPMHTRRIVLDAYIASGRPVIAGTGILAAFLRGRHQAGDSIADIARDHGLRRHDVEEAVSYGAAA